MCIMTWSIDSSIDLSKAALIKNCRKWNPTFFLILLDFKSSLKQFLILYSHSIVLISRSSMNLTKNSVIFLSAILKVSASLTLAKWMNTIFTSIGSLIWVKTFRYQNRKEFLLLKWRVPSYFFCKTSSFPNYYFFFCLYFFPISASFHARHLFSSNFYVYF